MLSKQQEKELHGHLERAQNPIFYYDNDADGLCSFLLLRRFLGRGNGVAIRSYPELDASYAKKAEELQADAVFIVDKPVLSRAFLEALAELSLPIVWIDHHNVAGEDFSNIPNFFVYNPAKNAGTLKSSEPVTFIVQQLCGKKEDLWIAMMGCIADHYLPDFAKTFAKGFPEYWGKKIVQPFDAYYRTDIGNLARALNLGLKDSASNVVKLQHFLLACQSPGDVFAEVVGNEAFRETVLRLRKRYDALLTEAKEAVTEKLVFYVYQGETSMSSDLSNELSYLYPKHTIAVVYRKGAIANVSLRGKNVKTVLERMLPAFSGATGGGHQDAVGARIAFDDVERFHTVLQQEIGA